MYSPGARLRRSTAVSKRLCSSVPCRGARGVNDRLTELVSELHRVQAVLHTNGKVDAEIEQCPSQMWGEWLIGRLFSVRPLYGSVSEIEHRLEGCWRLLCNGLISRPYWRRKAPNEPREQ